MADLPEPLSNQDKYLRNIAVNDPDITDIEKMEPHSRQEEYLKYIALNGSAGGGGGADVNVVQATGTSTTNVMSQNAVTKQLEDKVGKDTTINGKPLTDDIEITAEDIGTYSKDEIDNKIEETTEKLDKLGTAAYCDTGINAGNIPILNEEGKLSNAVIPSLAITDTYVANSEEEMLNLEGAEQGDICIRTDENKTYILDAEPKKFRYLTDTITELDNWVELQTPTSDVTSVNGQKGNVTITANDLDTYTKEEIERKIEESSGSSSINVVQWTGDSETDVMSQKAVTDELDKKIENQGTGSSSVAIGNKYSVTASGMLSVALGQARATQNAAIAIGGNANCNGESSISIGNNNIVSGNVAISIGDNIEIQSGGTVSIGSSSRAEKENSVALGIYSRAEEENVVSVGSGENGFFNQTRRIVNVGDPIKDQDAVTKKYLNNLLPTVVSKWEPTLTTILNEELDYTLSINNCSYVKSGILVFIQGMIRANIKSVPETTSPWLAIRGLPFEPYTSNVTINSTILATGNFKANNCTDSFGNEIIYPYLEVRYMGSNSYICLRCNHENTYVKIEPDTIDMSFSGYYISEK